MKRFLSLLLFGSLTVLYPTIVQAVDVVVPDAQLEALLRETLEKPEGALTDADLATIITLNSSSLEGNQTISDLTGLEFATNLTQLTLRAQAITDLSPLASLQDLQWLLLVDNSVTNLSPLTGLDSLTYIDLSNNQVTNLSPLASLPQLRILALPGNPISDFTPLGQIDTLETLNLRSTGLTSLQPLLALTSLKILEAPENRLTTLMGIGHLVNLQQLQVFGNYLSDITPITALPEIDFLTFHQNFVDLSAGTASATALTNLQTAGVTIPSTTQLTPSVTLSANTVEDPYLAEGGIGTIDVTSNAYWQASSNVSWLTITSPNSGYGDGTISFSVAPKPDIIAIRTATITLDDTKNLTTFEVVQRPLVTVVFPDPKLEQAVRKALGNTLSPITDHQLESLKTLSIIASPTTSETQKIRDLTGLEYANRLETIVLENQSITDITALASFVKLESLSLDNNLISDLTPLQFLSSLSSLTVTKNFIPLADFTQNAIIQSVLNRGGVANSVPQLTPLTSLTAPTDVFGPDGGSGTIVVSSNYVWTANSDSGWLTFGSTTSGTRNGTVSFTITPFPEIDAPRVATISILDETITITQRPPIPITFADPDLETFLIAELNPEADSITDIDLKSLVSLDLVRDPFSQNNPDISSLEGLQYAINLSSLTISSHTLNSLDPISGLNTLKNLEISEVPLQFTDGLSQLTQLENLTMRNCGLNSIPTLNCGDTLKILDIGDNSIIDISPLASLTVLETVILSYNPISILSPLNGLNQISFLDLSGTQPANLYPVGTLSSLETLLLSEAELTSLDGLSSLSSLRYLDITANQIVSLQPLSRSTNLTEIYGFSNNVEDLSPILKLPNLERIEFSWNHIYDLKPFLVSPTTKYVDLGYNYIDDLSPLTQMPDLEELSVTGNFLNVSAGSEQAEQLVLLIDNNVTVEYDFQRNLTGMVSESSFSTGPDAATFAINFTTNGRLAADIDVDWVKFSADPFAGSGSITLSAKENDLGITRIATVDLGFATITIQQTEDLAYASYLTSLGLDPASPENGKRADLDGDGLSNGFEYLAGYNMLDSASKLLFRIVPIPLVFGTYDIHYSPTNSGYQSQIEFSSDMSIWLPVSLDASTVEDDHSVLRHSPNTPNAYYRLAIEPID